MQAVPQAAVDKLEHWKRHPAAFVADVWGVDMEPFQAEGLEMLSTRRRVSIRSGHGVGKSALAAWSVLWHMSTHYPTRTPCTAPTGHQLDDVLRPEIGMWLSRMPEQMRTQFRLTTEKLQLAAKPDHSFAAFRPGNKANPDALQGFHSDNMLFVLDEASGIHDSVFEVSEGALSTPGARVLMTGNPTRASGYFYDSHHSMRAHYATLTVPCSASSRVAPDYIESMKRFGTESNIYRVRVLGEFPASDEDSVIPLDWVEAAVNRDVEPIRSARRFWGLDVARFGDARTALAKRWGNRLEEPVKTWRNKDTMQVSGILRNEYDNARDKPDTIFIDVIGLGAGVVDRCKELDLPVVGINVAEAPAIKEQYVRYRDELWFAGRAWFEARDTMIPDDAELIGELTTVKYDIMDSSGKIQVLSKGKMRRDGLPSPDLADAFLLTFAAQRHSKPKWQPIEYDNRGIV